MCASECKLAEFLDKSKRASVSFPKPVGSPGFRLLSAATEPKPACDDRPRWRWFWKYHSLRFMFISISAQIEGRNNSHAVGIICGICSSQDLDQTKSLLVGQCKTEICWEDANILFKSLYNYQTKAQAADLRSLCHHSCEQTVRNRDCFTHNRTWIWSNWWNSSNLRPPSDPTLNTVDSTQAQKKMKPCLTANSVLPNVGKWRVNLCNRIWRAM